MEPTKINHIGSSNNIFVKYTSSFWLIVAIIIFTIITLLYVNNFSQASNDKIMQSSSANKERLSDLLHKIENSSVSYVSSLLDIHQNDAKFLDTAEKTINTLCTPLIKNDETIQAYFYILNDTHNSTLIEKMYNNTSGSSNTVSSLKYNDQNDFNRYIYEKSNRYGKPFWEMCSSNTGEDLISYIVPLSNSLGTVGIIFSIDELFRYIGESEFSQDTFPLLLSTESRNVVSKNTVSDSLKKQLINNQFDSSGIISFENTDYTFFYERINDNLVYAEANLLLRIKFLSNVYIFFLGIASLICVWATQSDRFSGKNFFEYISTKIIGKVTQKNLSDVALNSHASAIAFQITLALALFIQFLLSIFASDPPIVNLFYLVILLVGSVGFLLYNKNASDNISSRIFVFFVTITPILIHFLLGGYVANREPYEVFWIACAITISVFLLSRKLSQLTFSLTIILILASLVIDMNYFNSVSDVEVIAFTLNTILVCLLIFSSVEIYYSKSKKDYATLKEEAIQIKETQTAFVHKEKMVTLGQLIAGVAHEINTPIGAVKAAGETLDTMTNKILKRLVAETKDYSDEDLDVFLQIVNMCVASIKEMRSTMETRKSKAIIREYFKSAGLENYVELANLVTKIEICDLEKIDDSLDLFFHPRITEFLKMTAVVMPFLNGTQTVIFASNRVSKIVFALKAFAHTSSSSEFIWYDVVKNIENIIILYHNQIKSGIEVIQDYDDNIPEIFGNPDEIGQVWTNLVQNSIHAMSGVGTLKITIVNEDNKWVKISFTDTGSGIKEENLKNIFVPFYTTKPLGEGSGLGLDICKKIVMKHDGTIEVTSKYGSGTTFTVSLPIKDKE